MVMCFQSPLVYFPPGKFSLLFCRMLVFFIINFFEKILSGIGSESNSLDPGQARHSVKPDLGANCLQKLLADDTIQPLIRARIHKMLFRIANKKEPDQTASWEAV